MKLEHEVAQMTFKLSDADGPRWSVRATEGMEKKHLRVLFSGPIEEGMADELRALATAIEKLEPEEKEICDECVDGWIEEEEMVRVSGEYQAYEPVGNHRACEKCNPLGV